MEKPAIRTSATDAVHMFTQAGDAREQWLTIERIFSILKKIRKNTESTETPDE